MSARGAPMQIAQTIAAGQPAFDFGSEVDGVKMVNLKQALEELHAGTTNGLPSMKRDINVAKTTTLARLIADPRECERKIEEGLWMRGITTRPDYLEIRDCADPRRKSVIDSILVQNIDLVHKVNTHDSVAVGVKYKGIRGRFYNATSENHRFLDIIHPMTSAPASVGDRCLHQPSLNGLQITAASFSNITPESLRAEFAPKAGAPGQSHLIHSPHSRILASIEEFTQGLSEAFCSQYDINPASIPYVEPNESKGERGLFQFPTKYLEDHCEWILKSQENLSHFNPVVAGQEYYVKFLPIDCASWADFPKTETYKIWKECGEAYLKEKLNAPFTLHHAIEITFLPDDDITRDALAVNLN